MIPVSSMFDMSDEDAEVIMSRIVELVYKHKTMLDVVKELTAKYGEESVFTGMVVQKAIDRNDRAAQHEEASGEFADPAFIFGEALGMSVDEATEVCEAVGKLALDSPKWKSVFAAVGRMFGERAVYAGAFLMYLYTKAEGEPAKKHDYGHG
jgi:hypothetical protein